MRVIVLLMGLSLFLMAGNCMHHPAVVYENPSEDYLNMTGMIDGGLEYKVTVTYRKNARAGDCPVFEKEPDICQVRPEEFSYLPQINERTHSIHIPLKELSPGAGSWWEPHDISICVAPFDPHSEPTQCQVLFSITKDQHDGRERIDLDCAHTRWSSRWYSCRPKGRVVEYVSQLNREYVVNIHRESDSDAPTTKVILDDLWKFGKRTEYLDRVLAELDRWDSPTLLSASKVAMREKRIDDGMLLYHTGTIRAQVDGKHYKPLEKGGNSPAPAIQSLMFSVQMQMSKLSANELKDVYYAIVPQLEKWNPQYSDTYTPGWNFETASNYQHVQTQFNEVKAKRIDMLHGLITLYRDENYAEAHAIVQMYESNYSLDQQTEEKLSAETTMQRIETELGIKGYMAALTRQRELMKWTQCYEYSADGTKTECGTNKAHR